MTTPQPKYPFPQVWRSNILWLTKYDVFGLSRHYKSLYILGEASLYWVSTLPSYGGHGPCECLDITFLVCHLITCSRCYMALWVGFPHPNSSLSYVWGLHASWKWRYNMFYLSRDHNIDMSRDFVGGVALSYNTTLLSLRSIGLMEVEIMAFVISVQILIPIPIPRLKCLGLQMAQFKLQT